MEDKMNNEFPESYPMTGGLGAYSYAQNSKYQRGNVEAAKEMIKEAIVKKFDINALSAPLNSISVADLGCSTGPNTFLAVQNIVEAIEQKYQLSEDHDEIPELQVFFNDHSSNDFNTLFKSFPPKRNYLAAGVPGSFYGRLFSKASIHIFHCSHSLNWLSRVPKEIMDKTSPAWNKGRIHYTNAPKEVVEAYATQFAMDMESFLLARGEEIVVGGLMVLLITSVPDVILSSNFTICTHLELLESCLMDMEKMGLVSESNLDSINLPLYFPAPKELMAIIERNGRFSIEGIQELGQDKQVSIELLTLTLRAALGGVFEKHFGNDIVDEVFDRYPKKLANTPIFLNLNENQKAFVFSLSVILKCKPNN
ncbi:loganic acid O-methyltransferase-like [Corylus avellana]|uniref:loganic acid O-methyltransferase-like n=1 Tax=Corylus avellana TaxID=13451 RepID=UPI001E1FBAA8|nr:loganic acid O-methyltransferase-like [Corylus avellana]